MTRFETLLQGYKNNALSSEELQELLLLVDANDTTLQHAILNDLQQNAFAGLTTAPQREQLFNRILENRPIEGPSRVVFIRRWMAAAAILLLLGAGTCIWLIRTHENGLAQNSKQTGKQPDVQPGGNKAILRLADGKTIVLDSAGNGMLTKQGNVQVMKVQDGKLKYEVGSMNSAVAYNTLSTPRGGQYQVVLPDGSKVWLNAASSIRFPTAFTGNERIVEITGEAYFEVMPLTPKGESHKVPFIVKINTPSGDGGGGLVEVLGTHFNINAYSDEPTGQTTLLEGSVKFVNRESSIGNTPFVMLTPGKQAVLTADSRLTTADANIDQVMAWKNGQFYYNNAGITTIMRQIARWYDVEVEYKHTPTDGYTISLSRNVPVSKLLKYLELSGGVHFTIEGKKVIVE